MHSCVPPQSLSSLCHVFLLLYVMPYLLVLSHTRSAVSICPVQRLPLFSPELTQEGKKVTDRLGALSSRVSAIEEVLPEVETVVNQTDPQTFYQQSKG